MFKLRNGVEVTEKMLNHYEDTGLSEAEIGKSLGVSRMGLYKLRKRMGCPVRFRSDRGVIRVSLETKRENWNTYMREYNKAHRDGTRRKTIRVDGKLVLKSRHNAPIVIGRLLKPEEVVHHIDGNPSNDSYDNLMVFSTQKDHLAFHRGVNISPVQPNST